MTDPGCGSLLQSALSRSLVDRCQRVIEGLLVSSQAEAAGLLSVAEDGSHHPMLNVGYDSVTFEHHTTTKYTKNCLALRHQLSRPTELLSWDHLPGFRDTYEAQSVYNPAGFRNGVTVVLQLTPERPVAVLHVSTREDYVSLETTRALAAVRPVLADWASVIVRFEAASLSVRETQVLALIRDGSSNAQIAAELFLSPRTVTTHVEAILRKLSAANRTQAAVLAERFGVGDATRDS